MWFEEVLFGQDRKGESEMNRWNNIGAGRSDGDDPFYLTAVPKINERTGELVETKKARMYVINGGEGELWIPLSQIIDEDENSEIVAITTWWARKKGLA